MKRWLDDTGSVTVEAALALSSLVIVAAGIIAGMATLAAKIGVVDAAGAAARSQAIGLDYEPAREGLSIQVEETAGLIVVEANAPAPIGSVSARAVFPAEYAAP